FFQAEDGIRDFHVTGVQTCALPICPGSLRLRGAGKPRSRQLRSSSVTGLLIAEPHSSTVGTPISGGDFRLREARGRDSQYRAARSEERRVGKECRCRWTRYGEDRNR